MSTYLIQEKNVPSRFELEDALGFILLEVQPSAAKIALANVAAFGQLRSKVSSSAQLKISDASSKGQAAIQGVAFL